MTNIETTDVLVGLSLAGGALYAIKNLFMFGEYITDKVTGIYNNMKEVKKDIKDIKEKINEFDSKLNHK